MSEICPSWRFKTPEFSVLLSWDSFLPRQPESRKPVFMRARDKYGEGKRSAVLRLLYAFAISGFIQASLALPVLAAGYTINVYIADSPEAASIKDSFIARTTDFFDATVKQSTFFTNTFSVNVKGLNPGYVPPAPDPGIATLETITRDLTAISTWTYVYGWADGTERERQSNADILGSYIVECSSPAHFGVDPDAEWSEGTCNTALMGPIQDIYEKSLEIPVIQGH